MNEQYEFICNALLHDLRCNSDAAGLLVGAPHPQGETSAKQLEEWGHVGLYRKRRPMGEKNESQPTNT